MISLILSGRLDLAYKSGTCGGYSLSPFQRPLAHYRGAISVVSGLQSHLERDGG